MKNNVRNIEFFLKPKQGKLFQQLCEMYPNAIVDNGNFILVPGEAPIMLIAHLDTVHRDPVRVINRTDNGNILSSPQGIGGDDRCGVFALYSVYKRAKQKPWLLFTCNEEVGGLGASAFCQAYQDGNLPDGLDSLKMLVEIDRRGADDAVYYDCYNLEFEDYISGYGFVTNLGSFSDISYIAPTLGVAAVNLSSGYYYEHTLQEFINLSQLEHTIDRVLKIVADAANPETPYFEYIEMPIEDRWYNYGWYSNYPYDFADYGYGSDVPDSISDEYEALLDYYSPDELEAICEEFGDWAIHSLYEEELRGYQV